MWTFERKTKIDCFFDLLQTELHRFASLFPNQIHLSNCVDDRTTHLIVGNEEKTLLCPLTIKLFQAIARHLFVVSYRWITECLKQTQLIDELPFEIRGDLPYGHYHDGMRTSRLTKNRYLFEKCQFFILCNGCQEIMSKSELTSLITLCHGTILSNFPLTSSTDSSVLTIIVCDKLLPFKTSTEQQLYENSRTNGVHFLNPEWIFESIVQYSLQPFDHYEEKF